MDISAQITVMSNNKSNNNNNFDFDNFTLSIIVIYSTQTVV